MPFFFGEPPLPRPRPRPLPPPFPAKLTEPFEAARFEEAAEKPPSDWLREDFLDDFLEAGPWAGERPRCDVFDFQVLTLAEVERGLLEERGLCMGVLGPPDSAGRLLTNCTL